MAEHLSWSGTLKRDRSKELLKLNHEALNEALFSI